ncbi:TrmH family RNA methyltransferase [Vagococcus xieshaowenii]|uniref:RNA methyltransferase n=1 Tax=Vagococcus xieshaowenii TaxID=2562451 RepID=A0AAJ5EGF1_9ENTE|nr:RNA methyltransferase [Vagococcus xieshaowenii]QCA29585.1 RNA methyltransferase [Vagococcus xieshaowenii]TFZ42886.1 RNA methyltransferase [Vagococcus xieshaowenii]
MKEITSAQNTTIKEAKKLLKNKYRQQTGLYMIEGEHLVEEAINEGQRLEKLFITTDFMIEKQLDGLFAQAKEIFEVSDTVMKTLSSLPTPQGIIAILKQTSQALTYPLVAPLLLLDNVQDPGNVGTMIRTADAAGYAGVVLGKGCADFYSNKVQRALQGSHFHLPVVQEDLSNFIPDLIASGVEVYATALDKQAKSYRDLNPSTSFAIVMGNEGQGVSQDIIELCTQTIYIPMPGRAESLNVAVAAGILMFAYSF